MAADEKAYDDGLYDENGDPLYPDRIYVPAIALPCTHYIRPPSIEAPVDPYGLFELQHSISLLGIGDASRYGRLRLIVSIVLPSIGDSSAVGSITLIPGSVTIRLPSIEQPECS